MQGGTTRRRKDHPVNPLQRARARGLLPHSGLANGQNQRLRGPSHALQSHRTHRIRSITTLEGITHPSKASGATLGGCARAHPPDSFLPTQTNQNYPRSLVLKPLKECSTPKQTRGLLSGIKIPGYPINGKIRYPACSLKAPL
jgi:hypothetical protein